MDRVVTVTDKQLLVRLAKAGLNAQEALDFTARATRNRVQLWYARLPEDWFDNPHPFPDGSPRHAGARTFMQPLKSSWQYEVDGEGFTIFFKHGRQGGTSNWGLRLQQYGGTIKPVKRKALTIPLTAEARGMRASTFEKHFNRKLFTVGKESGEKLGTLVWEDEAGFLHAAFALRKSSTVKPLRARRGYDAIPTPAEIEAWARNGMLKYLKALLET